ncbi:MAG: hypothetical protein sL5_10190 [Candidatus Mesenet longicola]|uniref:Uncharacterized protein n=1 Tax=Candidatus Mesenet longicola TaxID=1892558 RepID=A0A8J3HXE0_9RICK|nr:MAG: hypothetical protein sGL2_10690 [Candidatus Mesenet longicola]GHM60026.1 MAG: hypothetical protein sL5_10190 [Candidatus Mesenet longicola]
MEELECGIGVVEEEKLKVEQIIMDQQQSENIPDSNMSTVEVQSHSSSMKFNINFFT